MTFKVASSFFYAKAQMNDRPPYDQLPGESSKAYAKFLTYRNIKPYRRSINAAYGLYQERAEKGSKKDYKDAPGSWKALADKWYWIERANAYDAHLQAGLDAIEQAEVEKILTSGYALIHKRIAGLDRMAKLIERSFIDAEEEDKINFKWLTPDKVREYRGCLDDIAKELGQRIKKQEITGKDGGPLEITTDWGGGKLDGSETSS